MKLIIYILTLLFTSTVFGQTTDRRAELDIQGRVNEISVAPDEKIWLVTALGNTYYTGNIDSNWHYGNLLVEPTGESGFKHPNIERISFFNKDTAIMTGYLSAGREEDKKNGLYLTKNGGKLWQMIDFGGDSWIYNAFVDRLGNAWMGGSSGDIFYSGDFGQHWQKLNAPFNSFSRMHSIFMLNADVGISGALRNDIYITANNWKSSKRIETPFDQKKYTKRSNYADNRIEKVVLWNNFIVVNQDGHIYYSEAGKIDWKPFPVKVYDFELDQDSKTLIAITDSFKIASFTSPAAFRLLTDQSLPSAGIDIKVVNHSLFVLSSNYSVYKVNKNGLTHAIPYTTDEKIAEPQIIKQAKGFAWGANGHQLYLAEDSQQDWYRENVLDFGIADFMLLSDSAALLWDGVKDNYIYSLKDHKARKYVPEAPLKSFLASPVETFLIHSGSRGCFHNVNHKANYKRLNDSTYTPTTFLLSNYQDKASPPNFKNKANGFALKNALTAINLNPSVVPPLKDFRITEKDKQNYLALVDQQLKSGDAGSVSGDKEIDTAFFYAVPSMLDTLDGSITQNIFNQQERVWSTTSNWFNIQLVNQRNDTLNISRNYYVSTLSWHLPWNFEYKGLNFNCYNIDFSRFIRSCIPDNFMGKEAFDNSFLIMEIANYLWNKED